MVPRIIGFSKRQRKFPLVTFSTLCIVLYTIIMCLLVARFPLKQEGICTDFPSSTSGLQLVLQMLHVGTFWASAGWNRQEISILLMEISSLSGIYHCIQPYVISKGWDHNTSPSVPVKQKAKNRPILSARSACHRTIHLVTHQVSAYLECCIWPHGWQALLARYQLATSAVDCRFWAVLSTVYLSGQYQIGYIYTFPSWGSPVLQYESCFPSVHGQTLGSTL